MIASMTASCLDKQARVKEKFQSLVSPEEKYERIMEMGRALPPLALIHRKEENIVEGCQSRMYLIAKKEGELIFFEAESEALISAGLASLLIHVYSGEKAETILTCPPTYLEEIGIPGALTPGRANGLYSLHLRMKRLALDFLTKG
jgi:cysteine desulfuration protein SufE